MKFKHHHHPIIMLLVLYNLIVKTMSLWRAARNRQRGWFLVLAFTNSLGILDYLYMRKRRPQRLVEKMYP